jgi:hypothetical protein
MEAQMFAHCAEYAEYVSAKCARKGLSHKMMEILKNLMQVMAFVEEEMSTLSDE